MSPRQTDALDQVHPDLVDLLIRSDLLHPEEHDGLSEVSLARAIIIAIELADPEEQALLVSRIMPEEEMAAERLRSPEVQDTSHRVVLDREERKAAFIKDPSEPEPPRNGEDCIVCTDSAHVRAPCGCNYCLSCYREALRIGLRSQEEFPPRCCQPFDEEAVALARSPALVHIFRQMDEERRTPIPDRVYCHDGNCAAFIPPDRNGRCLICHVKTCLDCGARSHRGKTCVQGDAEEDVWATMDANRSVNCPGCGRMIQLSEACNHMTCPCGCEFCYLCGAGWKHCHCPLHRGFERMVPMRDRPGVKPPQFRRRPRAGTSNSQDGEIGPLRIPQLRPEPGEERRSNALASRRTVRPLMLPQNDEEEARREQQRRDTPRHQVQMQPGMFRGILPNPFPPVMNDHRAFRPLPNAFAVPEPPRHRVWGGQGRHGHGNLVDGIDGRMTPRGFINPAQAMRHGRIGEEQRQHYDPIAGMAHLAIADPMAAMDARIAEWEAQVASRNAFELERAVRNHLGEEGGVGRETYYHHRHHRHHHHHHHN